MNSTFPFTYFTPYFHKYTNNTLLYRYLVPNDLTAYHFNYIIRKRIKLPEKDSLYFFVNGKYLLKGGKLNIHTFENTFITKNGSIVIFLNLSHKLLNPISIITVTICWIHFYKHYDDASSLFINSQKLITILFRHSYGSCL